MEFKVPHFDQPICFDVAHHDLINEPEYEALSYVCGDVTDRADAFHWRQQSTFQYHVQLGYHFTLSANH